MIIENEEEEKKRLSCLILLCIFAIKRYGYFGQLISNKMMMIKNF